MQCKGEHCTQWCDFVLLHSSALRCCDNLAVHSLFRLPTKGCKKCLSPQLNTTPSIRRQAQNSPVKLLVVCVWCACEDMIRVKPPATYPKPFIIRISGFFATMRFCIFPCCCYCGSNGNCLPLWCDISCRMHIDCVERRRYGSALVSLSFSPAQQLCAAAYTHYYYFSFLLVYKFHVRPTNNSFSSLIFTSCVRTIYSLKMAEPQMHFVQCECGRNSILKSSARSEPCFCRRHSNCGFRTICPIWRTICRIGLTSVSASILFELIFSGIIMGFSSALHVRLPHQRCELAPISVVFLFMYSTQIICFVALFPVESSASQAWFYWAHELTRSRLSFTN